MRKIGTTLATLGSLFAIVLIPPIAEWLLCLAPLHRSDVTALWWGSACVFVLSWAVLWPLADRHAFVAKLGLVLFSLAAAEAATRFVVIRWTDYPHQRLERLGRATFPDELAIKAHPFAHFTGQPRRVLEGGRTFGMHSMFNEHGFPDAAIPVEKPPGACRIACIGASTTMLYPGRMRSWLREQAPEQRFETVNFSQGWYTTNHAVVNFTLHALDYSLDYVVLHHGWNDGRAAQNAAEFRGDYSHVFRAFSPPSLPDRALLRASVIYRAVRFALTEQDWTALDTALLQPVDAGLGKDFELALSTYSRNVRTIVDLALLRGMTPVLVTLPHSTDPDMLFAEKAEEIARFAARLREIASEYGERVLFVDLDRSLTGRNEIFTDVGHMTTTGLQLKAEQIGAVILRHRRSRQAVESAPGK